MKKHFLFLFILVLSLSCRKEPISWDVDTLIPILHTKMTLQQALPDDALEVINGNELQLIYSGNLISLQLDSTLAIPDTSISDTFSIPFGSIVFPSGSTFLSDSNFTRFDFNNTQLTHLYIREGEMSLELISSLEGPSVFEYSLPTMKKNGVPFFVIENIPAAASSSIAVIQRTYDISGYEISLTGIQNDNFNVLANEYRAYIDSSSSAVTISAGQSFRATNTLSGIKPSYIRGSFGSETSNESSQNEPLEIFEYVKGGSLSLESATMEFEIKNEIGMDLNIVINDISGNNAYNNTSVSLISPLSSTGINLNRATETQGIYSAPNATQNITLLNNQNSNLNEFIGNLPQSISYDFEINLNPLGNVSAGNDFLYENTGIEINLDAQIPLNLNASNLILSDTTDFEIDSGSKEESSKIIGGYLNIYTLNWFPFSLENQFYMLDKNQIIIDSIFAESQMIYGGIPVFGIVEDPQSALVKASLTPSKIAHLYQTKSLITKMKLHSTSSENIRILDTYFLDARIVGDFEYQISIP